MKYKTFFTKTYVVWLTAVLCCLLWGSAFPAIKTGYALLNIESSDTASIILFAGIRFTFAGLLTLLIVSVLNRKVLLPSKSSVGKIGVLALFQTVLQYVFFYLGLAFTTGARGSIINGTSVFFALMISSLLFRFEKMNLRKILGCLIGFAGVVLVSFDTANQAEASLLGDGLILMSAVSYAFSSVFMKKYSDKENPAMLSGWQFVLGGLVMTAFGLLFHGSIGTPNPKAMLLITYLAMLSAVAYSLWSILLKYNPVSKVAVCGFMIPVFGFFLSALFSDGESGVGVIGFAALILVIAGMLVVNYEKQGKLA